MYYVLTWHCFRWWRLDFVVSIWHHSHTFSAIAYDQNYSFKYVHKLFVVMFVNLNAVNVHCNVFHKVGYVMFVFVMSRFTALWKGRISALGRRLNAEGATSASMSSPRSRACVCYWSNIRQHGATKPNLIKSLFFSPPLVTILWITA